MRAGRRCATRERTPRYELTLLPTDCYVADVLERRGPFRPAHIAAAQSEVDGGRLLMAGAFTDEPAGAAFVFTPRATREDVARFVAADPYVLNGLVMSHRVQEWALPVLSASAAAAILDGAAK